MPGLTKFARHAVKERRRAVERCAERVLERGGAADLHALRVAVKRLRYRLEFFRELLGSEAKKALDILAKMQDRLGTISDADTFRRQYLELLQALPPGDARRAGLEALLRDAANRREAEIRALRERWPDEARALAACLRAA